MNEIFISCKKSKIKRLLLVNLSVRITIDVDLTPALCLFES